MAPSVLKGGSDHPQQSALYDRSLTPALNGGYGVVMQPQNDAQTNALSRGQFHGWLDHHCREGHAALCEEQPSDPRPSVLAKFVFALRLSPALLAVALPVSLGLAGLETALDHEVIQERFTNIERERLNFENESGIEDSPYTLKTMARAGFTSCGAFDACTLGEPGRTVRMATTQSDQGQAWLDRLGPLYDGIDAVIYRFAASSPDDFVELRNSIQSTIEGQAGVLDYIASTTTDEPALYVLLER